MGHPKGAGSERDDRVDFDRRVRLEFRGAQISSDGDLLVMRELDDALGLSDLASSALCDSRPGKNTAIGSKGCSDSRSTGGWRAMKMLTMPTGWPLIPSCARSLVVVPSMCRRPQPRKWGGSRPEPWRCPRTGKRWPI